MRPQDQDWEEVARKAAATAYDDRDRKRRRRQRASDFPPLPSLRASPNDASLPRQRSSSTSIDHEGAGRRRRGPTQSTKRSPLRRVISQSEKRRYPPPLNEPLASFISRKSNGMYLGRTARLETATTTTNGADLRDCAMIAEYQMSGVAFRIVPTGGRGGGGLPCDTLRPTLAPFPPPHRQENDRRSPSRRAFGIFRIF